MQVIGTKILDDAMRKHSSVSEQISSWLSEVKSDQWSDPHTMRRERFPNARIIGNNRVVFNVKGNKFHLVVKVNYEMKFVEIRFFGTHAEYDRIDASKV